MCFILLGDLGGTNIRLYIIESDYDLKNFHCKLSLKYKQKTVVNVNGETLEVDTYSDFSQVLHDFLAEYSKIFEENIKEKPEAERNYIMENPRYMSYMKRTISPEGQIQNTETKYLKFWTGEAIDNKDPNARFFRLFSAMAIAGNPVENKIKKFSNINWGPIDGDQIRESFGLSCFHMLNDFHANGFTVPVLQHSRMALINRPQIRKEAQIATKRQKDEKRKDELKGKSYMSDRRSSKKELTVLMGMGTGLGVCAVVTKQLTLGKKAKKAKAKSTSKINLYLGESEKGEIKMSIDSEFLKKQLLVIPSEGGNMGFAFFDSENDFDLEFQKFVKEKYGYEYNFLTQEFIYCGKSIHLLYQFINKVDNTGITATPTSKEIFELALQKEPSAVRTYEKFLEYLGASIFSMNVTFVNQDKLILIGNIINKVYRVLYKKNKKKFWALIAKRLLAKSHFTQMLRKLKIYIYDDQDVMGIKGIFNFIYLKHIKPAH